MSKFQPGNPGGPGRPEGSKNKNYLNASIWLELIWQDVQTMDPEKRQPIMKWAVEQIFAKVQVLPATPGDSVSNGIQAFQLMNGLAPINTPAESNPSANGGGPTHGA